MPRNGKSMTSLVTSGSMPTSLLRGSRRVLETSPVLAAGGYSTPRILTWETCLVTFSVVVPGGGGLDRVVAGI